MDNLTTQDAQIACFQNAADQAARQRCHRRFSRRYWRPKSDPGVSVQQRFAHVRAPGLWTVEKDRQTQVGGQA